MTEHRRRYDDEDPKPHRPIACSAVLERYDGQPDVCTIYDRGGETPLRTTWLSAQEGSFVDLEDVR